MKQDTSTARLGQFVREWIAIGTVLVAVALAWGNASARLSETERRLMKVEDSLAKISEIDKKMSIAIELLTRHLEDTERSKQ